MSGVAGPVLQWSSAGPIDAQSVRSADTVPASTRGFDAGKKVRGRRQFIVTDALGLLLAVRVVAASIRRRDGAKRPLLRTRLDHPGVRRVWVDRGFTVRLADRTARILGRDLEIIRRPEPAGLPGPAERWAAERTFSWLTAHQCLARTTRQAPPTRRR